MRISIAPLATALALTSFTSAQPDSATATTNGTSPTSSPGCPQFSPGPVSGFDLASQLSSPAVYVDVNSIEAIRQASALYALALDGRDFETLRKVFTDDARANYSDPIGVLEGVQAIIDTLPPGLQFFASTQHHLGTQRIYMCGPGSAVSVTYFQASHFLTPYTGIDNPVGNDQVLIDRAQYQDVWARQGDGSWKITNRTLVRMVCFCAQLDHSCVKCILTT